MLACGASKSTMLKAIVHNCMVECIVSERTYRRQCKLSRRMRWSCVYSRAHHIATVAMVLIKSIGTILSLSAAREDMLPRRVMCTSASSVAKGSDRQ